MGILIGISGKIGAGKDTLATIFEGLIPNLERKSYAFKLKHICAILSGTDIEKQMTQEGKNIYLPDFKMTCGQMQQIIGTDVMRTHFHPEVWVLSLFADYNKDKNWIVTDVRFKNEAAKIKEMGGYLIRLNGDPMGIRAASKRDLSHPSETDLDDWADWDLEITNNGPIEELEARAKRFLEDLDKVSRMDVYNMLCGLLETEPTGETRRKIEQHLKNLF